MTLSNSFGLLTAHRAPVFAAALCASMAGMAFPAGAGTEPQCAAGQVSTVDGCLTPEAAADGIRAIVRKAIEDHSLPAAIVAVSIGDTEILTEAWGESMTGIPATTDMHFRNGAIAIPYLTTVLLKLQEDGALSIDDPLSNWFPDYPKADQVTLRMLANCTAGYADYVPVLGVYDDVFRQWTPRELIDVGLSKPMACEPGTCFNYAHTNFVILGEVLTKVTGKPVAELIKEQVLVPLGLNDTRSEDTAVIQEPVLHAFTGERDVYEDSTYWNPSWTLARGAVMTTNIPDALKTAVAIGEGSLLSAQSQEQLLAPLTVGMKPMREELYYGLGVAVANSWIMQTPSFAGYAAVIGYLPSRKIAMAITSTMSPDSPERVPTMLANDIGAWLAADQPPGLPVGSPK